MNLNKEEKQKQKNKENHKFKSQKLMKAIKIIVFNDNI
jgi:hypothetical protein